MSCLFTARCWRFFMARLWLCAALTGAMGWANAEEHLPTTAAATTTLVPTPDTEEEAVQTVPDIPADALAAPTLGLKAPAQGALTVPPLPKPLAASTAVTRPPSSSPRLPQVDLQFPQEYGLASWYGAKHHNKRTASGERFDMHDFTAAHPTLPFGSRVCVRSALTGREVVVRINDRGGFAGKRVIDISRAAAEALGMAHLGTKPVTVQPLDEHSGCPDTEAEDDTEEEDD